MGLLERLSSEYAYFTGIVRILGRLRAILKSPDRTIGDIVADLAREHGGREALVSDQERITYRDYDARANQYARWIMRQGLAKGGRVALLMHNRPEYLVIWLGIARAGGVTALLNTNLTGQSLAHCINIVEAAHIVVGSDLVDALETARPYLQGAPAIWVLGQDAGGHERLEPHIAEQPDAPLGAGERPALHVTDQCLFIYTSGTTGLPKAANINHYRVLAIMNAFCAATRATGHDRMYVCLPLYHSSGGVLATGTVLIAGGTAIIRERFSAREFWDDIVRHNATMFQYIGELCRYLLNSPTNPNESRHRIRLCSGNGLRPDIWTDFQTRFRIPQILEWYASTEGNATLLNLDGRIGAVGRIPGWMRNKLVIEVVRVDHETEQPVRGPDGFCTRCGPDEPGEVISAILNDPDKPNQRFEGYADRAETERKVLRDAFAEGDAWFRTGDLMRRDALGYFYFVDRLGDTFRWKGENVATSEVTEVITVFPGVRDANVYGVQVPGHDGRAGMAALVVDDDVDLQALRGHIHAQLPDYARPLFLRLRSELDMTGTFKHRKVDLVKQGFDPGQIADEIHFDNPETGAYELLDAPLAKRIRLGGIRL